MAQLLLQRTTISSISSNEAISQRLRRLWNRCRRINKSTFQEENLNRLKKKLEFLGSHHKRKNERKKETLKRSEFFNSWDIIWIPRSLGVSKNCNPEKRNIIKKGWISYIDFNSKMNTVRLIYYTTGKE